MGVWVSGKEATTWPFVVAYTAAGFVALLGLWCSVIGFTGGTLPLIGLETTGSPLVGLGFLIMVTPTLARITFWITLAPLLLVTKQRTR
ncbi:hypothetical protein ACH4U6_17260 [Streptomyces netropsis]|uniref:hypothetical protein n=1 Tax=Streptomyces netropsis TaxID=55404 RepID=UPI0037A1640C